MSVKKNSIRGRAAKRKGSRAEISVRNALRNIYPVEYRQAVQRVPLSGASAFKGDVFDGNDYDSCYEVKCQETLCLPDWWRQAKSQAGISRTPVLVFTQSYRPFYYAMKTEAWESLVSQTLYNEYKLENVTLTNNIGLMDKLPGNTDKVVTTITVDGDSLAVAPEDLYITIKKEIFTNLHGDAKM